MYGAEDVFAMEKSTFMKWVNFIIIIRPHHYLCLYSHQSSLYYQEFY